MNPLGYLKVGEIIQLNPETTRNKMFAGCLMIVTEVKGDWGCQGYVQGLGVNGEPCGPAYYRAKWEEMEPTGGQAPWVRE